MLPECCCVLVEPRSVTLCAGDECPPLSSTQVADLYGFFMVVRTPSRVWHGWNGALFSVLPIDKLWRLVEMDAYLMVDDGPLPFARVCVCNTDMSGMTGSHWFSVAYSVKYSLK